MDIKSLATSAVAGRSELGVDIVYDLKRGFLCFSSNQYFSIC